jgi:hypothetical protein
MVIDAVGASELKPTLAGADKRDMMSNTVREMHDGTRIQDCKVRNLRAGDVVHPTMRLVIDVRLRAVYSARKREVVLERPDGSRHAAVWGAETVVSILERRSDS